MRPPKSWLSFIVLACGVSAILVCLVAVSFVAARGWDWEVIWRGDNLLDACFFFWWSMVAVVSHRWVVSHPHGGLKRLSLVAAPVASAAASWLILEEGSRPGEYAIMATACATIAAPTLLALLVVFRWVRAGFSMHGPPMEGGIPDGERH